MYSLFVFLVGGGGGGGVQPKVDIFPYLCLKTDLDFWKLFREDIGFSFVCQSHVIVLNGSISVIHTSYWIREITYLTCWSILHAFLSSDF